MMKKTLLIICLAAASSGCAFAQSVDYSVKGGLNWSTDKSSTNYPGYGTTGRIGFHIGAVADIPVHQFSIQPGLYFITKGYVEHYSRIVYPELQPTTVTTKGNVRLNYLELPVNLLYHFKPAPNLNTYFGAGPYVGFGLSGKVKNTSSTPTSTDSSESDFTFGFGQSGNYSNPDYGINFIVGQRIKRISIDLNYSLGLANITHSSEDKLKNRVAGLSLGYLFK